MKPSEMLKQYMEKNAEEKRIEQEKFNKAIESRNSSVKKSLLEFLKPFEWDKGAEIQEINRLGKDYVAQSVIDGFVFQMRPTHMEMISTSYALYVGAVVPVPETAPMPYVQYIDTVGLERKLLVFQEVLKMDFFSVQSRVLEHMAQLMDKKALAMAENEKRASNRG